MEKTSLDKSVEDFAVDLLQRIPMEDLDNYNHVPIELVEDGDNVGKLPTLSTEGAAGYDCFAFEDTFIPPFSKGKVRLGIKLAVPKYFAFILKERSGMALNTPLILGAGVIDSDYRGELAAIFYNGSSEPFFIEKGRKIVQGLFVPVGKVDAFKQVTELEETARGEGGFGSTGAF